MCGRITQTRSRLEYIAELGEPYDPKAWVGGDVHRQYNMAPGYSILTMHRLEGDGETHSARLPWGYRSPGAKAKGYPKHPNARIESAPTDRPWVTARILVPVDGWFEWTREDDKKLPWYFTLADGRPLFMAAVTNFRPYENGGDPELGVAIVTTAAGGPMGQIHNRRPVVLAPEEARRWLDADLQSPEAVELARRRLRPPDVFKWHRVSPKVNRVVPMMELSYAEQEALIRPLGSGT